MGMVLRVDFRSCQRGDKEFVRLCEPDATRLPAWSAGLDRTFFVRGVVHFPSNSFNPSPRT